MERKTLKTALAAAAVVGVLAVPLAPARAEMMMPHMGGGGFDGAGAAMAGAGLALGLITTLLATHHADAENVTTGRKVDCFQLGNCHMHVVRDPGQDPQAHLWIEPKPKGKPAKEKKVTHSPRGTGGFGYDPSTGLTTSSYSNGDGTRTVTVTNANGQVLNQYQSR